MPYHGNRYYHHSTDTGDTCSICGKAIKMFWKDKDQLNGFSDTTTTINLSSLSDIKGIAHYFCVPGAKSLQQLNDERKKLKS